MTAAIVVTIYVRHGEDCKYRDDETAKRCQCRKHFRWMANGRQHRRKAGTRSWAEAEALKRNLEDQLSGRAAPQEGARNLQECIAVFLKDKALHCVTDNGMGKYRRELERLRDFCERRNVYTVQGISRELLTDFVSTWPQYYPSSYTRGKVRERYRSFFKYAYDAEWIQRKPVWPKIKIEVPPTMPLEPEEFDKLLDSVKILIDPISRVRTRSLFLLMRWTGLAVTDALTLPKSGMKHDKAQDLYRVVTSRQKTKTDVSVPIPKWVALELLATPNLNPDFFFWTGVGTTDELLKRWFRRYIGPVYNAAGLERNGNMTTHRLRDTFACDLLGKGVPMEEVSKALGHKSIKTTELHYAKWVKGRQDRLDSLVVGTWRDNDSSVGNVL